MTSYNRNFAGRNDANPATHSFIASPDIVTAFAFAGNLKFNPLTDTLNDSDGKPFKLINPTGNELPPQGFCPDRDGFQSPPDDRSLTNVSIDPKSDRLQFLQPFNPRDGGDATNLPILIKVKGKCSKSK